MRILADENIQRSVVTGLRELGHDVRFARETNQRSPDENLLELATRDRRALVTYDTDFGELIHHRGMPAPYGVALFRIHKDIPADIEAEFVLNTVNLWDTLPPGLWTVQIRHSTA